MASGVSWFLAHQGLTEVIDVHMAAGCAACNMRVSADLYKVPPVINEALGVFLNI
jgi:hypothetical protein